MIKAAGIIFLAPSGRVLLLRRSNEGDAAGLWALPGGKLEEGENEAGAAVRETLEETGYRTGTPGERIAHTVSPDVEYTTFLKKVDEEFIPVLDSEHTAYTWISPKEAME